MRSFAAILTRWATLPAGLAPLALVPGSRTASDSDTGGATDRWIAPNGIRLHYREWGRSDGPPLLILHGLTGHPWEFDGVASALADRYRVLAVSQRGHGGSEWGPAYSPHLMAEDIAGLIRDLELPPVRLVGHSMGGVNAWWLASRHPDLVERLVIIDVTPEVITGDALVGGWLDALDGFARARYAQPELAVAEYLARNTGAHEAELTRFVLDNLREEDGRWAWRFDALGLERWMKKAAADPEAHWSALRRIACPTLLVRAGDSPFTRAPDAERMAAQLADARLVEIPDSGHDVHIDQPERLLEELRAFLR